MRLFTLFLIVVIVGLVLNSKSPDTYQSTYGVAIEKGQNMWSDYNQDGDSSFYQDVVNPDGSVTNPDPGTILGKPYDYYSCFVDENCKRFSVIAKCDVNSGECYIPND